ncbi:MAG: hypothetical protein IPL54_01430 [Chitinophagaceae bacterium]|nr:hypothetical protein [Chitinophagaceae bacterium]
MLSTQVHITIESSVVIEAAQFGIPSLVLNSNVILYGPNGENMPPYGGPSYFKTEREKGYVQVYAPGLNITGWITSQTKKDQLIDLEKNEKEWIKFMQDINTPYNIYLN